MDWWGKMNLKKYQGRKHTVIISSNKGKGTFTGFLDKEISYDVQLSYDSLFRAYLDYRNELTKLSFGAGMVVGSTTNSNINSILDKTIAPGLSWTRKIGGIPEFIEFNIPVILWVEDTLQDVTNQLSILYDIAVPTMNKTVAEIAPLEVKVLIGDWFIMEQAFVTKISHKWSETLIQGVPAWCNIDINVTSVYIVDRAHLTMTGNKIVVTEVK